MFCTQFVSFLHVTCGVLGVQQSRASRAGGRILQKKTKFVLPAAADCQSCLLKASRIVELEARVSTRLSGDITRLS